MWLNRPVYFRRGSRSPLLNERETVARNPCRLHPAPETRRGSRSRRVRSATPQSRRQVHRRSASAAAGRSGRPRPSHATRSASCRAASCRNVSHRSRRRNRIETDRRLVEDEQLGLEQGAVASETGQLSPPRASGTIRLRELAQTNHVEHRVDPRPAARSAPGRNSARFSRTLGVGEVDRRSLGSDSRRAIERRRARRQAEHRAFRGRPRRSARRRSRAVASTCRTHLDRARPVTVPGSTRSDTSGSTASGRAQRGGARSRSRARTEDTIGR